MTCHRHVRYTFGRTSSKIYYPMQYCTKFILWKLYVANEHPGLLLISLISFHVFASNCLIHYLIERITYITLMCRICIPTQFRYSLLCIVKWKHLMLFIGFCLKFTFLTFEFSVQVIVQRRNNKGKVSCNFSFYH